MVCMTRSQRMRSADAAWLGMDRPQNRLVVSGVLRLSGPLDLDDLRALAQERMLGPHPRFCQLPRRARRRRARWQVDETFDLAQHVVDSTPAHPCDGDALARLIGDLVSRPLAADRPAWRLDLVRREDGGSAIVARFHHSLADGTALASVLLALTDTATPAPPAAPLAAPPEATPTTPAPARTPQARRRVGAARAVVAMVVTLARLVATLGEPPTLLRGPLGTQKVVARTRPHGLDDVKATARARGVSVNDVLLAATAGGLRTHLLEQGGPVADLRALVPVDLRGGRPVPADLGNLFGVLVVALPVGRADAADRLREVTAVTARLKRSAQAGGTYLLLRAVGALPRAVLAAAVLVLEESASVVVTNVPGPREPLGLAGCLVEDVSFWAPTVGRVGLGISLFSYAGTITVGVALDARLGLDASRLAAAIEDELTR